MRRDLAIVMATLVTGGCSGDLTGSGMPEPQVDADPGAPDADETPQQGTPDSPPAQLDDVAYCMSEINEYRASIGLPPYGRAADIDAFAAEGAMIDGTAHEAHKHFSDTNGGNGIAFAENEIPWWNDNDVRSVIDGGLDLMWGEGPGGGHYENMTGSYTLGGCGIFVNGGEITVTMDFR